MDKQEFTDTLNDIVTNYIEEYRQLGADAQLAVNPITHYLTVDVADQIDNDLDNAEVATEESYAADTDVAEEAMDLQSQENSDFYYLESLTEVDPYGNRKPNPDAINALIGRYF